MRTTTPEQHGADPSRPDRCLAAGFVDVEEVRVMLEGAHPDGLAVPPPVSVAHHLILAFLHQRAHT